MVAGLEYEIRAEFIKAEYSTIEKVAQIALCINSVLHCPRAAQDESTSGSAGYQGQDGLVSMEVGNLQTPKTETPRKAESAMAKNACSRCQNIKSRLWRRVAKNTNSITKLTATSRITDPESIEDGSEQKT